MSTNATNIVLVHGGWADGSSSTKEIPILENVGHRIITVNFLSTLWQMILLLLSVQSSWLVDQQFLWDTLGSFSDSLISITTVQK